LYKVVRRSDKLSCAIASTLTVDVHYELLPPTRVATTSLTAAEATHAGGAAKADLEYLLSYGSEIDRY